MKVEIEITEAAIKSATEQLTKERDELRLQSDIQAGSIEAVQSANQRLAANHKECVRCLGEALQDRANLAASAKLALDALNMAITYVKGEGYDDEIDRVYDAIESLRQAGVK